MDCCTANNASGTYSLPGQQTSTRKRKASHVMLSAQDELMIPSRASWLYCAMLFAQVGNNANCNSNDITWLQFISAVNVVQ
jgi:hypothetical protein